MPENANAPSWSVFCWLEPMSVLDSETLTFTAGFPSGSRTFPEMTWLPPLDGLFRSPIPCPIAKIGRKITTARRVKKYSLLRILRPLLLSKIYGVDHTDYSRIDGTIFIPLGHTCR